MLWLKRTSLCLVPYVYLGTVIYAQSALTFMSSLLTWVNVLLGYNRNTLWIRETVRQTSRGKSAAAGTTTVRPRPLTSRGMSAWPYRVTTKYSFYPVRIHIICWIKNNCANCALKREIQWFDGELFFHTCMTSPAKWADVTCQVKPEGRRPDPLLSWTAPGP